MSAILDKFKLYYQMFGVAGLFLGIETRCARQPKPVVVRGRRLKHPVHLRLKNSDIPTYGKIFLKMEYELALRHDPKVIFDLGANIGLASLFFADRYPNAKVIALEPESSNFELLKKNAAPYPNITPIQAAIWKMDGKLDLIDPGIGPWGFQIAGTESDRQGRIIGTVDGITIETLMRRYGVEYVDLLKVDIEGSEKDLFENAPAWLEKVGVIMIEIHDGLRAGASQSVYSATADFDVQVRKGENTFFARSVHVAAGSAR